MNSSSKIRVVATVIALPDKVAEVKIIVTGLLEPTRKEKGCIYYELLQNKNNAQEFVFVEEWESEDDLQVHLGSPHLQQAMIETQNLLVCPPDIQTYELIG